MECQGASERTRERREGRSRKEEAECSGAAPLDDDGTARFGERSRAQGETRSGQARKRRRGER